jgi:thioredoxin 2
MSDPSTVIGCPKCGTKNRTSPTPTGVPRCSACQTLLPWIVAASAESFEREIESSVPVLVDFWAPWCGPCRMLSPLVESVGRERAGEIKVVKLNVDEAPELASRYQVRGIPLLVLILEKAEIERLVGAVPAAQLQAWLEPHLAHAKRPGSAAAGHASQ